MLNTMRTALMALPFLLPFSAEASAPAGQDFKTVCVNAWMKSAPENGKVDYQNFGEKYCSCAAGKSLTTQDEVNKAAQSCMGQTLLRNTADALEDSPGLDKVTAEDVMSACQASWAIISPQTKTAPETVATQFCTCVQPQMVELAKKNEDMTDDQWYEKVDAISAACSQMPVSEKPVSSGSAQ